MDYCSYFIKDKALFASFPTQDNVNEYEENKVRYFVNLTYDNEKKIKQYTTKYKYIHFPIKDRKQPENNLLFSVFIVNICKLINSLSNDEKLLIHCKGGHSRSGLVVSCILCYYYNMSPMESLQMTSSYHKQRPILKDKWRNIKSPLSLSQIKYVYKFFEPLYFYKKYKIGIKLGFSLMSPHTIRMYVNGSYILYKNAEEAFIEYKKIKDIDDSVLIYKILVLKIKQHPDVKDNLLQTCLKPIIEKYTENIVGQNLVKIRNDLLDKEEFLF